MIKDVAPLLKECEETLKELKRMGNMEVACYVQGFINSINKLPDADQRPQWIPCSERLPDVGGYFLITTIDELVRLDYFRKSTLNDFDNYSAIAWMPLPTPYQEEGDLS